MTTVRVPCWLRDALSAAAARASVEPWVLLSHWLSGDGHIVPPDAPLPQALRMRYGGHFGADGTLAEERFSLAMNPRSASRSAKRRPSRGRAQLARAARGKGK